MAVQWCNWCGRSWLPPATLGLACPGHFIAQCSPLPLVRLCMSGAGLLPPQATISEGGGGGCLHGARCPEGSGGGVQGVEPHSCVVMEHPGWQAGRQAGRHITRTGGKQRQLIALMPGAVHQCVMQAMSLRQPPGQPRPAPRPPPLPSSPQPTPSAGRCHSERIRMQCASPMPEGLVAVAGMYMYHLPWCSPLTPLPALPPAAALWVAVCDWGWGWGRRTPTNNH